MNLPMNLPIYTEQFTAQRVEMYMEDFAAAGKTIEVFAQLLAVLTEYGVLYKMEKRQGVRADGSLYDCLVLVGHAHPEALDLVTTAADEVLGTDGDYILCAVMER